MLYSIFNLVYCHFIHPLYPFAIYTQHPEFLYYYSEYS